MKITAKDILDYENFIRRVILYWTWNETFYNESQREDLYGLIRDKLLEVGEIEAKYGRKSWRAFIGRTAYHTCVDYYRKRKRKTIRVRIRKQRKSRKEVKALLRVIAAREEIKTFLNSPRIKHRSLFLAYADGASRKEMAFRFNLTEHQVRGRIEHTKKLIKREFRRIEARQKLKSMQKNFR
jgi:DNA-directed RNA polymerase specialized sigma24 family protein